MRPGWRTSELSLGFLAGIAISEIASRPCPTVADGIVRAAACLALGAIAVAYAHARAREKVGRR